jgi:hypothetical protein
VPSSVMNTIKNATPYEKMLQQLYNQGYSNR